LRHGSARFGREFYNALFASALIGCPGSRAQDPQFLPEVDAYLKLNSRFRTYLQSIRITNPERHRKKAEPPTVLRCTGRLLLFRSEQQFILSCPSQY